MAEWHVTPDYIVENWTDEMLHLMLEKMAERKRQESEMVDEMRSRYSGTENVHEVSPESLAQTSHGMIEVRGANQHR